MLVAPLEFDPIARAGDLWDERIGDATSMRLATSIMRVQQLVIAGLEAALKPHGITFARYEVLRLISFSRDGYLPLSKIGERLMVHPTSVTNAIDRLESQGLVQRETDPEDRRRVLASLTPQGRAVLDAATDTLMEVDFGVGSIPAAQQQALYEALTPLRSRDFEV
ncbi:MarR family winged helix-turn-helix transcriptional regulator [Aeromicrobium sp. Root495]|uniref:MarR family winged helix-turn-helix transcriptional regulator n=1 Tax=Aeromicrobium sp. Root495 TaxID=1736550 RepID=UPI000AB83217|nr:MarR family transcriptional regulator [Aeromicrobium sp. Root495]RYJ04802.1 MAG: MarR family transcriptional regulator [Actinomycetales bacterium]